MEVGLNLLEDLCLLEMVGLCEVVGLALLEEVDLCEVVGLGMLEVGFLEVSLLEAVVVAHLRR